MLIGDAVHRLKIGVATGCGGARDVRLRAQGGTNRMMIGSGSADTLTVTPTRVGIGTITPQETLDVVADADVSGLLTRPYGPAAASATPVAYGLVHAFGTVISGTPNVGVSWNAANEWYEVSVDGHALGPAYTILVTARGGPRIAGVIGFGPGHFLVRAWDLSGATTQTPVDFVVFRP